MVYGVRTGDGIQPTTTISEELKNQERPGKKREERGGAGRAPSAASCGGFSDREKHR